MVRGFAYAYEQGNTLAPVRHTVGCDHRIHSVNPSPTHDVPVAAFPSGVLHAT